MFLYHGTSVNNAHQILREGFRDRVLGGKSNWSGKVISQSGFVYLTKAYPFFYASNAAKENEIQGVVIKVEVDEKDLYPDEDILRFNKVKGKIDIRNYKEYSVLSLEELGNVAVKPEDIKKIIGMKTFDIATMIFYSDPSMSPMNYMFLGKYYCMLTDTWWNDGDWKSINKFNMITL